MNDYLYESELGDIVKQKALITYNNTRTYPNGSKAPDGIEIRFGSARPTLEVRDMLKAHGFKFSEKQTMWYALDNTKSRALVKQFEEQEVDVDNTQYEKRNFWVRVKSLAEFEKLRERTEFYVTVDTPKNFYSKSFLKKAYPSIQSLINDHALSYKRFYNKAVDQEEPPQVPTPPQSQSDSAHIADKLRTLAEGMQKKIEAKLHPAISRQRPTKRRARIAQGMREEGLRLQEQQAILLALSAAHTSGLISNYSLLSAIRAISDIDALRAYPKSEKNNANVQAHYNRFEKRLSRLGINNPGNWSTAVDQLHALMQKAGNVPSQVSNEKELKIRELEMQVLDAGIPGFFPTPPELIKQLLELAEITADDRVLEPSAGKGDILDAIRNNYPDQSIDAIEIYSTLREILKLKGYTLVGHDFLSYEPEKRYDKIIMNPPFENGLDIDHVMHAYPMIRSTGRLVAIMGEGVFFRQFKKDKAFREFLQNNNAFVSEPIKEAFKKSFNATGVTVRIVAINGDGSAIKSQSQTPQSDDAEPESVSDMELLELEAEAELELLKMRVDLERKKQRSVNGLAGIDEGKLQRLRQKAWSIQDQWDVLDFK
ncbi:MAG TPA: hypothetical protein VIM75_11215 [Ohtaekwangia sp.]|uniref:hypothetical protein n=1 Tax=Ohtaekwangia sp. TaxID=2066019 RepID=UPI002F949D03